MSVCAVGVFAAPFVKEEEAKRFIRLKRQSGYWDPHHSQNQWGYTVQEQANEYYTALRTDAQYYMDMSNLMFDRSPSNRPSALRKYGSKVRKYLLFLSESHS
uniref:Uncharacterized protein n=1 Tax=Acanthochromis polyacanthus TaxID=80966 RepID=A0A3Q1FCV6_9TELE